MYIVMHCGGIPFNGNTIKERSLGGSESSAYYLAREFAKQGHRVVLFTNSEEQGEWEDVKYQWAGPASEQFPLGQHYHWFVQNTPHDVNITQRVPFGFAHPVASKINVLHLHDLGLIRQAQGFFNASWNIDLVLTVSEHHAKQVKEVYGFDDVVLPITNGVDFELFKNGIKDALFGKWFGTLRDPKDATSYMVEFDKQKKLIYSSRPERGLENLVGPNAIMERLLKEDPSVHLYVCGYDNTVPQMRGLYEYLWKRCEELPNVTNLGALTKQELADVQRQCDAWVYPTQFEEVSCITAMECMAAGLKIITSDFGAIPETLKDTGAKLIPYKGDAINGEAYIKAIKNLDDIKMDFDVKQRYKWKWPAAKILNKVSEIFDNSKNELAIINDAERNSDIVLLQQTGLLTEQQRKVYDFAFNKGFEEHYKKIYDREDDQGRHYGPEDLTGNPRYEYVSSLIQQLPDGATVLDYGCAHGHYTMNLAMRFPKLNFIGMDITKTNIDKANEWANNECNNVNNVKFIHGYFKDDIEYRGDHDETPVKDDIDCLIAAEVLEHTLSANKLIDNIAGMFLKDGAKVITTTPYGPWEAQGYDEHYPWRAHIHHFERADLHDMFGGFGGYNIAVVPSGNSKYGTPIGSYVCDFIWANSDQKCPNINYSRKIQEYKPQESLSVCMIVRNAEDSIKRALDSVVNAAHEIIIGIDDTTDDKTREIINEVKARYECKHIKWNVFDIESPLKTGFAVARNTTINQAKGDWIMWLDSDEKVVGIENVYKYLRNNHFNAYGVAQHHFSVFPAGIIKTDWPSRIFRNNKKIKFYGVVHEHPELGINKGVGKVLMINDVAIYHDGYITESIRRARFNRNIGLMVRDKEENPDRLLGKFLWVRDLALMNRWELESNGGQISQTIIERAQNGIDQWEEFVNAPVSGRMIVDSLEFYSELVAALGQDTGFNFALKLDSSKTNGQQQSNSSEVKARFLKREHLDLVMKKIIDERTNSYESKYF